MTQRYKYWLNGMNCLIYVLLGFFMAPSLLASDNANQAPTMAIIFYEPSGLSRPHDDYDSDEAHLAAEETQEMGCFLMFDPNHKLSQKLHTLLLQGEAAHTENEQQYPIVFIPFKDYQFNIFANNRVNVASLTPEAVAKVNHRGRMRYSDKQIKQIAIMIDQLAAMRSDHRMCGPGQIQLSLK